ncbi:hypothetical protein [Streptomyces sp. adm13(2018)]|uniref:hypothetical protein n=1 Tax=Streptomyces sp. adm13(2018) TaxID=2479007 RepID=UPI0011CDB6CD|nr:hypothetical protein [Streptomyces sp. adm13(2018)]
MTDYTDDGTEGEAGGEDRTPAPQPESPPNAPAVPEGISATTASAVPPTTVPVPRKRERVKVVRPTVTFGPVENGLDYLLSVTEHLAGKPKPRDLKYAILHLAAATEVLFKARLQQEHWSLVFENPRDATRSRFEAADFISCGSEEALDRLEKIAGLDITQTGSTKGDLARLIKWRNALQHYGLIAVQVDGKGTQAVYAHAVEKLAANLLAFLIPFVREHLRPKVIHRKPGEWNFDAEIAKVTAGLANIEKYLEFRWAKLLPELEPLKDSTVTCPLCKQPALVVDGNSDCRFCETQVRRSDHIALEYVSEIQGLDLHTHYKDGGEDLVLECPDCGVDALVTDVEFVSGRTIAFLCFACASEFEELDFCTSCSKPIEEGDEDGHGMCEDCFGARLERF